MAHSFVAGGVLSGAVNVGKYSYSGAMQGAGNRSGTNVPVIGKYTANNQGAAGAVTSGNSNTQVQQGGSQTAGDAAVFNSGIASNTGTQTSNNGNRPAAVTGNGAMQTGTTANVQTPTAVQHQMQAQTDTRNGKTIKAEGKVSELLQEAMAQPADRQ